MYYRVTVTKDDKHFFATSDTITTDDHLKEVYKELIEHFTVDKGYKIEIMLRYTQGNDIKIFKHRKGYYEIK